MLNNSGIPQHEIEHIARCILPDILAYYESEEGQREFREWLAQRETVAACLGAQPREITFTTGGSEADNQAIISAARLGERNDGGKMQSQTL